MKEGLKYVEQHINPIEIKRGMDKARVRIIEYLSEISTPVTTKEDLYKMAMVSTNYDKLLSKVISETLWEIGEEGVVEIEPGNIYETDLFFV